MGMKIEMNALMRSSLVMFRREFQQWAEAFLIVMKDFTKKHNDILNGTNTQSVADDISLEETLRHLKKFDFQKIHKYNNIDSKLNKFNLKYFIYSVINDVQMFHEKVYGIIARWTKIDPVYYDEMNNCSNDISECSDEKIVLNKIDNYISMIIWNMQNFLEEEEFKKSVF
jgi:hypothetical protein